MYLCYMKKAFRIVAFLEGVSYILLLFVGVPFKYLLEDESYVKLLGMPHGLLFVGYLILAYLIKDDMNWGKKDFGIVMLASLLPFGTFYVEKKYFTNPKE